MRKIGKAQDIEIKRKKSTAIFAWFFIGIMVVSLAGFALLTSGSFTTEQVQEGYFYDGNYWVVNEAGQSFYFLNSKEEAAKVPISITKNFGNYAGLPLYIDAEDSIILNEIASNLARYSSRVQEACYGSCERDIPEKDCSENMIVWRQTDVERVYEQDNCVFIEGSSLAVDAFLYRVLGLS